MVFKGTAVTRGRGRAVVTATGMATEMGNVARLLGRTEQSPDAAPARGRPDRPHARDRGDRHRRRRCRRHPAHRRHRGRVGSRLGAARRRLAGGRGGARRACPRCSRSCSRSASSAWPAGARSSRGCRRSRRSGRPPSICSDKTGTLTQERDDDREGRHRVGRGRRHGQRLSARGRAARRRPARSTTRSCSTRFGRCSRGGSLANDAVLREENGEWTIQGDPDRGRVPRRRGEDRRACTTRGSRGSSGLGEIPFTSERKLMSTIEADVEGELGVAVVTKGAPDVLLARCTAERVAGEVRPLTDERRRDVLGTRRPPRRPRAAHARRRLPAAARRSGRPAADESMERELVYLGLVGIIDPPRPEARAADRRGERGRASACS